MPIPENELGEYVMYVRNSEGLSRSDIVERAKRHDLDISDSYIRKIEHGEILSRVISVEKLAALSVGLGIDRLFLLGLIPGWGVAKQLLQMVEDYKATLKLRSVGGEVLTGEIKAEIYNLRNQMKSSIQRLENMVGTSFVSSQRKVRLTGRVGGPDDVELDRAITFDCDDWVNEPESVYVNAQYAAVMHGNSMSKRNIRDGDILFYRVGDEVEHDDVVIAMIEDLPVCVVYQDDVSRDGKLRGSYLRSESSDGVTLFNGVDKSTVIVGVVVACVSPPIIFKD